MAAYVLYFGWCRQCHNWKDSEVDHPTTEASRISKERYSSFLIIRITFQQTHSKTHILYHRVRPTIFSCPVVVLLLHGSIHHIFLPLLQRSLGIVFQCFFVHLRVFCLVRPVNCIPMFITYLNKVRRMFMIVWYG